MREVEHGHERAATTSRRRRNDALAHGVRFTGRRVPLSSPASTTVSHRWLAIPTLAALGLGLTTISSGMRLDDYLHGGQLHAALSGTSTSPWWDIFFLADFNPGKRFSGTMPWWTVDDLHIRFFRPIAALSHLLDHALWPRTAWPMHVHSILLHLTLVGLVAALYRRYFDVRKSAIAALVFAVSVNHASTVTWIANRNALLAAIFGIAALLLHQDWCAGRRRGLLALPSLAAALLSAEASVCIFGFLLVLPLPEEATRHPSATRRRWTSAALLLALTLFWRALYTHYGFGAVNSGAYIDPMRSPALFASVLPERLAWLFGMGLGPLRVFAHGPLPVAARVALGTIFTGSALATLRAAWAHENRLWLVSGLIAMVPLVASTPDERLLTLAFVGVCPAIAGAILGILRPDRPSQVGAIAAVVSNLLVSPALFASYALNFQLDPPIGLRLERTESRNLVLISAPSVQDVTHLLESRFVHELPRPAFIWYLWISESPEVRRDGCCAVEIRDPQGHGREPFSEFFRSQDLPLEKGQTIKTLGFDVRILEVANDWYATAARFDFRVPLEHPNLVFADWTGADFENVGVPTASPR